MEYIGQQRPPLAPPRPQNRDQVPHMLSWLRKRFQRHEMPPQRRVHVSPVRVTHDDKAIVLRQPNGAAEQILWSDLGSVSVITTDGGPFEADLFWVLAHRDGRRGPVVPMDAQGEHELLKAMQRRLPGFDNMAVVEAMGSASDASFVVWEHGRREMSGAS
jgi:hypothetical protein